jgi:chromosome segregation ATPase
VIEWIMVFSIGFLAAMLVALFFMPLVHRRAVRLTARRLEALTPMTAAEILAERDQLRAEFAMSVRRLEMSLEEMKTRATAQSAELGRKCDAINWLKKELDERTATISALQARHDALSQRLEAAEGVGERATDAESQRLELASARAQLEALHASVANYQRAAKENEEHAAREQESAHAASRALVEARSRLKALAARTAELERQLVAHSSEAERFTSQLKELERRGVAQDRLLAEGEAEIERLRAEAEAARRSEPRKDAASARGRAGGPAGKHRAEVARLEKELAGALEERGRLQAEVAGMKQDAEAGRTLERVETALLRERIQDVAAQVASLTAAMEGPGSPIESLLIAETPAADRTGSQANGAAGNGSGGEAAAARTESKFERESTLAKRIRALRASAARLAPSN